LSLLVWTWTFQRRLRWRIHKSTFRVRKVGKTYVQKPTAGLPMRAKPAKIFHIDTLLALISSCFPLVFANLINRIGTVSTKSIKLANTVPT